MSRPVRPSRLSGRRGPLAAAALVFILLVLIGGIGYVVASASAPSPSPAPTPTPTPTASPSPSPSPTPSPTPSPSPTPTATASPTPKAYEDLSGIPSTAALAHRYPIAVMLDDHPDARPQAGLAFASVVYQAPVEGDIPRYMAVFQAGTPPLIGPVRSARFYFVKWASELGDVYLHWGGPPPLLSYLNAGRGGVINADGATGYRVGWRAAPHNVYTSGERIRGWADRIGATSERLRYEPETLWHFRDPLPIAKRGADGGTIRFAYRLERVDYVYERGSGTWLRSVGGHAHHDAGVDPIGAGAVGRGPRIAPRTVIVMSVQMQRTRNISGPALGAVEAHTVGSGAAWVFVEGRVIEATWRKPSDTGRTRFLDRAGNEIVLPRGQIFVQVINGRVGFSFDVEAQP